MELADFDISHFMAETVYGTDDTPLPATPAPAPTRTIYVQLQACGTPDRRPAAGHCPPPDTDRPSPVSEIVQVVRLGPADCLVPRLLPYRRRADRPPAHAGSGQPPAKRGRGRPRKTGATAVQRHGTVHRTVEYVTADSAGHSRPSCLAWSCTPTVSDGRTVAEVDAAAGPLAADQMPVAHESGANTHRDQEPISDQCSDQDPSADKDPVPDRDPHPSLALEPSVELSVSGRSRRVDGMYICEVCHAPHAMLRNLLRHEKEHTEPKYPCPMCNAKFTLPKLVRKHQKFHKVTTAYQCDQCGRKFRSQLVLLEHMHSHTGRKHLFCAECGRRFAGRHCYRAHVRWHAGRARGQLECAVCERVFVRHAALEQHQAEHGRPRLVCPQHGCQRLFHTEKRLASHLLSHLAATGPWRCRLCDKQFKTKYSMRDHVRAHSGERPFACQVCTARFSLRSNLIMHVRYVHQNDRRYECRLCGKRFKRRRLLTYHEMAHEGRRPLQCRDCPLQMIYPEHLRQHMRTHSGEKPFSCEVCGKSFSRSDNMKAHMFTHSNKKPFECRQCGMGFMRKMPLVQHMEQMGHGEHPDDYVINRTLVTSVSVPEDEEVVHTFQLLDSNDGHMVMLVTADSKEAFLPSSQIVPGDSQVLLQGSQIVSGDSQVLLQGSQIVSGDSQVLLQGGRVVASDSQEALLQGGHIGTPEARQESAPIVTFLTEEAQYVTDGGQLSLVIDEQSA